MEGRMDRLRQDLESDSEAIDVIKRGSILNRCSVAWCSVWLFVGEKNLFWRENKIIS